MNQALERDPDHQPTLRALVEYYENKGAQDKAAAYRARLTSPEQKASPP